MAPMMHAKLIDLLDALHATPETATDGELAEAVGMILRMQRMDSGDRDTLRAAVERGPLFDGDVPSKSARDQLLSDGFMAKVVVKGEDGQNAATQTGWYLYRLLQLEYPRAFDVVLLGWEAEKKVPVIREVRAIASLLLKEAKDLVESAGISKGKQPIVKGGITRKEAEGIAKRLEEVGARVELRSAKIPGRAQEKTEGTEP